MFYGSEYHTKIRFYIYPYNQKRNALCRERFLSCIKHHSKNEFSFLRSAGFLPSVLRDHVLTV